MKQCYLYLDKLLSALEEVGPSLTQQEISNVLDLWGVSRKPDNLFKEKSNLKALGWSLYYGLAPRNWGSKQGSDIEFYLRDFYQKKFFNDPLAKK